jgi:hypothetical protein
MSSYYRAPHDDCGYSRQLMRTAASDHVRRLCEVKDHLTAVDLKPGFHYRASASRPSRGVEAAPWQNDFVCQIESEHYSKPSKPSSMTQLSGSASKTSLNENKH